MQRIHHGGSFPFCSVVGHKQVDSALAEIRRKHIGLILIQFFIEIIACRRCPFCGTTGSKRLFRHVFEETSRCRYCYGYFMLRSRSRSLSHLVVRRACPKHHKTYHQSHESPHRSYYGLFTSQFSIIIYQLSFINYHLANAPCAYQLYTSCVPSTVDCHGVKAPCTREISRPRVDGVRFILSV